MNLQRKLKRKAKTAKLSRTVNEAFRLYGIGRHREAEAVCNSIIAKNQKNGQAYQILGFIAMTRRQFDMAVSFFTTAASLLPATPEVYCNLGIAYRELESFNESRKALLKALELAPDNFEGLYHIGILELRAGKLQDSLHYLNLARNIQPMNIALLQLLAETYIKARNPSKAIETYELYLRRKEIDISKLSKNGTDAEAGPEELLLHFNPAELPEINRDDLPIIAQLANLFMRSRQLSKARIALQLVLNKEPDNIWGNLVLATIDRQNGNLEMAAERMRVVVNRNQASTDLSAVFTELGRIYDLMGKFEEAFSAFEKAHQVKKESPSFKLIDRSSMPSLVQQCTEYCTAKMESSVARHSIKDSLPTPLFLVGFPRSGTTLTESIIRSQLDIQTSDEFPVLHKITFHLPALLNRPFKYPKDLDTLSEEEIHYLRNQYWERFKDTLGISPETGRRFLDKLPLNIIHLNFIEKIFPEARVIMALRDPRDVCLSNFMQAFDLNDAMVHFLDLEACARLYAGIMHFWFAYKKVAEIEWHETRYEDLVISPEPTTEKLIKFIIGQNDQKCISTKNHSSPASDRIFSTPSYYDVTQPIYSRAKGRWKNYERYLTPAIPLLEEFLIEFGYEKGTSSGNGKDFGANRKAIL